MTHTAPQWDCRACRDRRHLVCSCGGPPETEHAPDCSYERGLEELQEEHDTELDAEDEVDDPRELVQDDHGAPDSYGAP